MSDLVKISWSGEMTDEQKNALNDVMNVMGLQSAADMGLIPQAEVDAEMLRLSEKYPEVG